MTGAPRRYAVCQLGARMQYAVPRLLYDAGALECCYTDLYVRRSWGRAAGLVPPAILPEGVRRLLSRPRPLPDAAVRTFPGLGLRYALRNRAAVDDEAASASFLWAGEAFGSRVVQRGFGNANAIYAFNTAAVEILTAARDRGLFRVVEQTIAPRAIEEQIISAEQQQHPGWQVLAPASPATRTLAEREAREWELADLIVCGSEYVRAGIAAMGGPVERCAVVPYGVRLTVKPRRLSQPSPRLRVLIVGHISLRKGAPYALSAAKQLESMAEFRWVGPSFLTSAAHESMAARMALTGAVPSGAVANHYEWADVFLLPSVCEGSATVTYEALASGLPVVTTDAAGSMVRDGVDGFIVKAGDADAIAARLHQLHDDRPLLAALAAEANAGASRLTLEAYGARLLPQLLP